MDKELPLRSPFNGDVVTFPPYLPQETVDALLKAGFTKINEEPVLLKARNPKWQQSR